MHLQQLNPNSDKQVPPSEMSDEELVSEMEHVNTLIEQLQAGVMIFKEELQNRLEADKVNGRIIGNKTVTIVSRVSFATTLEQAREFNAIAEAVDTKMLKKMHDNGVPIPGVKVSRFLSVRDIKDAEDN